MTSGTGTGTGADDPPAPPPAEHCSDAFGALGLAEIMALADMHSAAPSNHAGLGTCALCSEPARLRDRDGAPVCRRHSAAR